MSRKTSATDPIRVDFLKSKKLPMLNKLGLTFAPGKKQTGAISGNWDRDLKDDIETLRNVYLVDTLISLVEDFELDELGIPDLVDVCDEAEIEVIRFPIPDGSVPVADEEFDELLFEILDRLSIGENVVIHCKGGLGRAGTVAACSLLLAADEGFKASEAIKIVRAARPGAVENKLQEQFIERYFEKLSLSDYLIYWDEAKIFDYIERNEPVRVVESDEFSKLNPGDTVWIVSLIDGRDFVLAGRLIVEGVLTRDEISEVIKRRDIVGSEYYGVAFEGDAEQINPVPITSIAPDLRFKGRIKRLDVSRNGINPKQMGSPLELEDDSAALLLSIWNEQDLFEDEPESPSPSLSDRLDDALANPEDYLAHYNLGVAYVENYLIDEAVESYKTAISLAPERVEALYNLGRIYLDRKQFDDAIEALNTCIFNDYEFTLAHFLLGLAHSLNGNDREAVESIKNGLTFSPDDALAHYNLGRAYFNLKKFDAAIEAFERASESMEHEYWIGRCYRELGDYDREIMIYRNAVEAGRRSPNVVFALGVAYIRLNGGHEGAAIEHQEFESFDPSEPDPLFRLGLFHIALNEPDDVLEIADLLEPVDRAVAAKLRKFLKMSRRTV